MRVLGIETSCDETAVAVVEAPAGDAPLGALLSNVVYSQMSEHRSFGGVVPEIAARAHLERLDGLVADALRDAGLGLGDLDGIAATGGPGLIGGVMVGVMTAKALALLDDGVKAWGAISPRPNAASLKEMYFDEEIARLKLVGTKGAPITAPTR